MKKIISCFIAIIVSCLCLIPATAAEEKYKLSFNTNGIQEIKDREYKKNEKIELPAGEAEGYMFIGWYADEGFSKLFTTENMPAHDTTVYGLYAVALSKLAYKFKDVDINKKLSETGMSADKFKKLASEQGFEIVYVINGKQYIVKDIVNYMDEIIKQANNDIAKGATAGMSVTIKLSEDDIGKVYTFNVYNDIVSDISETTTSVQPKTETIKENKENEKNTSSKSSKLPVIVVCVVFVMLAIVAVILSEYKNQIKIKNKNKKNNSEPR